MRVYKSISKLLIHFLLKVDWRTLQLIKVICSAALSQFCSFKICLKLHKIRLSLDFEVEKTTRCLCNPDPLTFECLWFLQMANLKELHWWALNCLICPIFYLLFTIHQSLSTSLYPLSTSHYPMDFLPTKQHAIIHDMGIFKIICNIEEIAVGFDMKPLY